MTTPAIHVNEFGSAINRITGYNMSGGVVYGPLDMTVQFRHLREDRPASVTSAIRADKTRAPLYWEHDIMSLYAPSGTMDWTHPSLGERYKTIGAAQTANGTYGPVDPDVNIPQAMLDRALLKALLKLKDGKVNMSVMAAEARKTAGMLGRFAKDMEHVLTGLRANGRPLSRGTLRQLGKLTDWKSSPGRYLEWCYGVQPLLQDIDGSMRAIADAQNLNRPLRLKVVGVVSEEDKVAPFLLTPGGGWSEPVFTWACRRTRLVKYSLTYDVPSFVLRDLSQLGLANPLETLYELTPYSFVLDWVFPVGDWISVLDAGAYLDFKEGSLTRFVRLDRPEILFEQHRNPTVVMNGFLLTNHNIRGMGIRRNVVESKPLFAGIPRLKSPFQLDKLAKGLALLTQVFR